ncbi:ATP-binding protein [Aquabacterium sp.]|uniref:ATP-binding protein n=1 Tax=Aquabacterium sp. TaxID=1872578 RepID=UPI002C9A2EAA|nr:ATP-binding protein [Aquabacterium sp.]HSW08965.1 ATP-binding protein [Aquabacterium sp.]
MTPLYNRRILIVDDMPTIHEDFRKILAPPTAAKSALDAARAALFGDDDAPAAAAAPPFELDSAYQGQEGLALVQASLDKGLPYAMAFVDMRMPPGWDGVETIEQLWRADPRLQVVICTAYSDTSWEEVFKRLDARDRLLILKKPFDNIEVRQLAHALTAKWQMTQQLAQQIDSLEAAVDERTRKLTLANEALQSEIAERKHLEAQLVQQEKLASIGQLAAGVAHEINNPIGFIFSNFGTLEGYLASLFRMLDAYEQTAAGPTLRALHEELEIGYLKEDVPSLMRESKDGIRRVRQIVQDLKDFSHVDALQDWQLTHLHQGIDSTLNVVASELRYKADVVKEYGEVPEIECLATQINQVVMNLVVNAAHAMGSERGRIVIRTGSADGEAWFEVADNGSGIPKDVLPRIFDPFFTTKPIGKGTGLGLSLSYGIVQKHQGRITVDSAPGRGTTFRVTLPLRHSMVAEAAPEAVPA